ncbi:hypothetical protein Salat_0501800 [Sesamum alatum]|uniref:DUF4283 domain-containing protein n=1 Tax=Sesamum alatum TaxID=300844 RepID=A0AAE1Z4I2_9LAMI|nr:hypothetical protein Salat_0501800 [Sesamum alatum]
MPNNITKVGSMDFHAFISDLEASPSHSANPAHVGDTSEPRSAAVPQGNTNHKLTDENYLTKFAIDDGALKLEPNDLIDVKTKVGHCLVGYIAGKFPGLKAIRALAQSWGASFQQHESRWLIFRFARDDDRQRSLPGDHCFEFKEDDIGLTPIWAILPSLPLECWNPNVLGKIGSGCFEVAGRQSGDPQVMAGKLKPATVVQGQPGPSKQHQETTDLVQQMPSQTPEKVPHLQIDPLNSDDESYSSTPTQHCMPGFLKAIDSPNDLKQKQKLGGMAPPNSP